MIGAFFSAPIFIHFISERVVMKLKISLLIIIFQTLSCFCQLAVIKSPTSNDIFYVGDTISIIWEADSAYLDVIRGAEMKITNDKGKNWFEIFAMQLENQRAIVFSDDKWAFNPKIVIRDTISNSSGSKSIPLANSEIQIKIHPYGNANLYSATTECCIKILPRKTKILSQINQQNRSIKSKNYSLFTSRIKYIKIQNNNFFSFLGKKLTIDK